MLSVLERWHDTRPNAAPRQYRPTGNCPAENVSWYDAMAYCRWLTARLGYEVRLPTEPEWQQAATGGNPGNEYPWGPAWGDACANTGEGRLGRTTAVGMYPRGASPQGMRDLAGNVWEWCLSDPDRPQASPGETRPSLVERLLRLRRARPDADRGEEVRRVVRGGSWGYTRGFARCAARNFLLPGYRSGGVGFRVVCGSPIP
jgi:formylglycine-generating enzyme required for sulfatase activity